MYVNAQKDHILTMEDVFHADLSLEILQDQNVNVPLLLLTGMDTIVYYAIDKEYLIRLWELAHVQIQRDGMDLIVLVSVQKVTIKLENYVSVL